MLSLQKAAECGLWGLRYCVGQALLGSHVQIRTPGQGRLWNQGTMAFQSRLTVRMTKCQQQLVIFHAHGP